MNDLPTNNGLISKGNTNKQTCNIEYYRASNINTA